MSDLHRRLERIERACGVGDGCPACAGREVERIWVEYERDLPDADPHTREPKPEPITCPTCGRNLLRLTVIRVVYVEP